MQVQIKKKINRDRKTNYPELEDKLYTWLLKRRISQKVSISYEDIKNMAKSIVKNSEDPHFYEDFKFSNGWLQNFLERHHLSSRAATHRAQENTKTNQSKANIIIEYLSNLNRVNRGQSQVANQKYHISKL